MGMNFVKFHLLLHLSTDLLKFGPSSSTDSSAGESMHKDYKDDARRTQKNTGTLDKQTAKNHADSHAIDRAIRELNPPKSLVGMEDGNGQAEDAGGIQESNSKGVHFYLDKDGMFDVFKKPSPSSKGPCVASWGDPLLLRDVRYFLKKKVLPGVQSGRILLKTQATVGGTLYRADPGAPTPRHDWVNIGWGIGHGIVPARIMIFLDLPPNSIIGGTTLDENVQSTVDHRGVLL
jgi:hypothetical protein